MIKNLLDNIGDTSLVPLKRIGEGRIFVKLEKSNPAGSIKDRPAFEMIKQGIDSGKLKDGMKIVEPTSGNTGIALAMIGRYLGYEVLLIMPDTMSVERRKLIEAYGAKIELTPGSEGMSGAVKVAQEYVESGEYFMPGQFDNPANVLAHEKTTGPEIYRDLEDVKGFIAGVGTGGTVSGVGKFLKTKNPDVKIWALEPEESPIITKGESGGHKIQGIGANFIPSILDREVLDKVITVNSDEAIEMAQRLGKEEGLLVGISSGANVVGALKMAQEVSGKIVTVLPDTAERYLSTPLFK